MPYRKLPYREGSYIAIPLQEPLRGYGIGVVARMDGGGGILGYFFRNTYEQIPARDEVKSLQATDAILIRQCGDLGLLRDEWKVIGANPSWDRTQWPVPLFAGRAVNGSFADIVEYSDEDGMTEIRVTRVPYAEAEGLPATGLSGWIALERILSKLIAEQ